MGAVNHHLASQMRMPRANFSVLFMKHDYLKLTIRLIDINLHFIYQVLTTNIRLNNIEAVSCNSIPTHKCKSRELTQLQKLDRRDSLDARACGAKKTNTLKHVSDSWDTPTANENMLTT